MYKKFKKINKCTYEATILDGSCTIYLGHKNKPKLLVVLFLFVLNRTTLKSVLFNDLTLLIITYQCFKVIYANSLEIIAQIFG